MEESSAKSVLIVHGDAARRREVASALSAAGYGVDEAVDGADGIGAFRHRRHDAIVAAVELPKNDGFAFLRMVRGDQHGRLVPVVMVSEVEDAGRSKRAEEHNVSAVLIEPIDIAQLVSRVSDATGGSQEPVRDSERFNHAEMVEVRCDGWNHFVEMVTENVSQGGMFITTHQPPPVFTRVRVRIVCDDGRSEVVLQGEVRHVVSPERARKRGVSAGMGIRFFDLDDELRRHVAGLVRRASKPEMKAVTVSASPPEPDPLPEQLTDEEKQRIEALSAELGRVRELDYFQRLELPYDAEEKVIRRAFRERARAFHPDRHANEPDEVQRLAQEIYLLFNEAKKQLKRAAVREQLRRAHSAVPKSVRPRRRRAAATPPKKAAPAPEQRPRADASRKPVKRPPPKVEAPSQVAIGTKKPKPSGDGIRRATALAMKALNDARYDVAIERLEGLIERGEKNTEVLLSLELAKGHLHREQEREDEARRHFERACAIDPGCVRAIKALRLLNAEREEQERGVLSRLFRR